MTAKELYNCILGCEISENILDFPIWKVLSKTVDFRIEKLNHIFYLGKKTSTGEWSLVVTLPGDVLWTFAYNFNFKKLEKYQSFGTEEYISQFLNPNFFELLEVIDQFDGTI